MIRTNNAAPNIPLLQLAKNRKAKASKGGAAGGSSSGGGGMGAGKAGPTVIAPLRDQALGGGPLTAEQKAEGGVVTVMAVLFVVILLEGIFLAASVSRAQRCAVMGVDWMAGRLNGLLDD